jgi:hypothetical protein
MVIRLKFSASKGMAAHLFCLMQAAKCATKRHLLTTSLPSLALTSPRRLSSCSLGGAAFALVLSQVAFFLRCADTDAARAQANYGELTCCNSAAHGINVHPPSLGDLMQWTDGIGVKRHRAP